MEYTNMKVKDVIKALLDADMDYPLDIVMVNGDGDNEVFRGKMKIGTEGVIFLNGFFAEDSNEDFIDYENWDEI